MTKDTLKFKELLDKEYIYPCKYLFKFIVTTEGVEYIKRILGDEDITLKPSRTGKYISVTCDKDVSSSDEILLIYKEAKKIKDIVSL